MTLLSPGRPSPGNLKPRAVDVANLYSYRAGIVDADFATEIAEDKQRNYGHGD
jgi:hypothetical protein